MKIQSDTFTASVKNPVIKKGQKEWSRDCKQCDKEFYLKRIDQYYCCTKCRLVSKSLRKKRLAHVGIGVETTRGTAIPPVHLKPKETITTRILRFLIQTLTKVILKLTKWITKP